MLLLPTTSPEHTEPAKQLSLSTWGALRLSSTQENCRNSKIPLWVRYMVPSARGDSLCCCVQQHFPLPLLCAHMGSCRKCSLCRDSAPSPTALDKPRNVPLSYFSLLPWQLTENTDSAMRLENPTYWELRKPGLQFKIFHQLQRDHLSAPQSIRPQSVYLSAGLHHCGDVLGRTG